MSTAIVAFNFESTPVRTKDINNDPWFCLSDVARVLKIRNQQEFLKSKRCDPDGVGISDLIDAKGRTQRARFIDEGNLYMLIARSNIPSAMAFQRWIAREVLPALRKTGAYAVGSPSNLPVPAEAELEIQNALCTVVLRMQGQMATIEKDNKNLREWVEYLNRKQQILMIDVNKRRCSKLASQISAKTGDHRIEIYSEAYKILEKQKGTTLTKVMKDLEVESKIDAIACEGWLSDLEAILKGMMDA